MAQTTALDISVVLSGGSTNINPNASIGGDPSSTPIINNVLNNLFDDVSADETAEGSEDYRCIYFFNDGETSVYDIKVFIVEDFEAGAELQIGIESRDETQRVSLLNAFPTSGSMTLSYEGVSFVSTYNADLGAWAIAMQNSLNSLTDVNGEPLLQDVIVTAQVTDLITVFDVSFKNADGKRKHDSIAVEENNLTPVIVDIQVTTPQAGAPLNTIAPSIGIETMLPARVNFFQASVLTPITLPKLWPNDGFPLWIKRTVEANTEAVANDGFSLRFIVDSLSLDS